MPKRVDGPIILDVIPTLHVPRPHRGIFSYLAEKPLPRGALVEISFGKRITLGVVVGKSKTAPFSGLKPVLRVINETALLPEPLFHYLVWEADSNVTPLGTVFARTIPPWASRKVGVPFDSIDNADIARKAAKKEFIYAIEERRFAEYGRRAEKIVRSGGQVLLLLPSAALQETFLQDFGKGFYAAPRDATKRSQELWLCIRRGEPVAIVGLRSALRLPFSSLELVIMDDESSSLWKERRSHPYIDGRIAAEARATLSGATLVVGGLSPTVNSLFTYPALRRKHFNASVDKIKREIIDLSDDRPRSGISHRLASAVEKFSREYKKGRALIFVNRKGAASSFRCADCDFVFTCTTCSAPAAAYATSPSTHRSGHISYRLRCRHCGQEFIPPLVCPNCRGFRLFPRGPAAERIESEILRIAPDAWVGRLDADTALSLKRQQATLNEFRRQKNTAILISTAMALSHKLPLLDIVVIPAFEQLLATPEFQIEEEVFSTLLRLCSRLRPRGRLIIQTWHPENRILKMLSKQNAEAFLREELHMRKKFAWPPYRRLAKLTFTSTTSEKGLEEASRSAAFLEKSLPKALQREVLDPFSAFIPRVRGKYIHHLLIKWKPEDIFDLTIERALAKRAASGWDIDVNPLSIL